MGISRTEYTSNTMSTKIDQLGYIDYFEYTTLTTMCTERTTLDLTLLLALRQHVKLQCLYYSYSASMHVHYAIMATDATPLWLKRALLNYSE
eukprot:5349987-Amphidinium_carterae.1